jgi:hypothetical protein
MCIKIFKTNLIAGRGKKIVFENDCGNRMKIFKNVTHRFVGVGEM